MTIFTFPNIAAVIKAVLPSYEKIKKRKIIDYNKLNMKTVVSEEKVKIIKKKMRKIEGARN